MLCFMDGAGWRPPTWTKEQEGQEIGFRKKERKAMTDKSGREGWEDGTPPPHREFEERSVVLAVAHPLASASSYLSSQSRADSRSERPSCYPPRARSPSPTLSSFSLLPLHPLTRKTNIRIIALLVEVFSKQPLLLREKVAEGASPNKKNSTNYGFITRVTNSNMKQAYVCSFVFVSGQQLLT